MKKSVKSLFIIIIIIPAVFIPLLYFIGAFTPSSKTAGLTEISPSAAVETPAGDCQEMTLSLFSAPVMAQPYLHHGKTVGIKVKLTKGLTLLCPADCWRGQSSNDAEDNVFFGNRNLIIAFAKNEISYLFSGEGASPKGMALATVITDGEALITSPDIEIDEKDVMAWYEKALAAVIENEAPKNWTQASLSIFSAPVLVQPYTDRDMTVGLRVRVAKGIKVLSPAESWHPGLSVGVSNTKIFFSSNFEYFQKGMYMQAEFGENGLTYHYSEEETTPKGTKLATVNADCEALITAPNIATDGKDAMAWYEKALDEVLAGIADGESSEYAWTKINLPIFSAPVELRPVMQEGRITVLRVKVTKGLKILSPADCWHGRFGSDTEDGVSFFRDLEHLDKTFKFVSISFGRGGITYLFTGESASPEGAELAEFNADGEAVIRADAVAIEAENADEWYEKAFAEVLEGE